MNPFKNLSMDDDSSDSDGEGGRLSNRHYHATYGLTSLRPKSSSSYYNFSQTKQYVGTSKKATWKRVCCGVLLCFLLTLFLLLLIGLAIFLTFFFLIRNGKLGNHCTLSFQVKNTTLDSVFDSFHTACQIDPPFKLIESNLVDHTLHCTHIDNRFNQIFTENITVTITSPGGVEPTLDVISVTTTSKSLKAAYDLGQNYRNLKQLFSYTKLNIENQHRESGCYFPYNRKK